MLVLGVGHPGLPSWTALDSGQDPRLVGQPGHALKCPACYVAQHAFSMGLVACPGLRCLFKVNILLSDLSHQYDLATSRLGFSLLSAVCTCWMESKQPPV